MIKSPDKRESFHLIDELLRIYKKGGTVLDTGQGRLGSWRLTEPEQLLKDNN